MSAPPLANETARLRAENARLREVLLSADKWFNLALPETDEACDFLNEDGWNAASEVHESIRAALASEPGERG